MSEPALIAVVGSINHDVLVTCPVLPAAGETVGGGAVTYAWGGKGANQAVASAVMAPDQVAMVGAVGDDALAESARSNLRHSHVDTSHVASIAGTTTGQAFVMIGANGENQIVVCPGANGILAPKHVPSTIDARVVSLCAEVDDAPLVAAVRAGSGAQVVYNVAPPRPIPAEILAAKPILIVNEHEAASLTNCKILPDALNALRALTGADVVITLGADGVLFTTGVEAWRQASANVVVVDSTGAGDAFCGAFVAALGAGEPIATAVRHGVALGALACTRLGARVDWANRANVLQLAVTLEPPVRDN